MSLAVDPPARHGPGGRQHTDCLVDSSGTTDVGGYDIASGMPQFLCNDLPSCPVRAPIGLPSAGDHRRNRAGQVAIPLARVSGPKVVQFR